MEVSFFPSKRLVDPTRVASHLVYLASQVVNVALRAGRDTIHGRVGAPDKDHLLPFTPHEAYSGRLGRLARLGQLKMVYEAHGTSYAFRTRVARVDSANRWWLHPPTCVDCTDRRLVHRHQVLGHPAMNLRLHGPWQPPGFRSFPMMDISTDGVGFLFDSIHTPMEEGILLQALIGLPGIPVMRCLLKLSNVRSFRPGSRRLAAGARYLNLSLDKRMELAQSIRVWEQKRRVA